MTQKTILLTGATDGIGLAAAKILVEGGHKVLLHGRNQAKLDGVKKMLSAGAGDGQIESYTADLSVMAEVEAFAAAVVKDHDKIDVLINNAGVFKTPDTTSPDGLDIRFAVNTIAPYLLTQRLMPLLGRSSRVVNLSSAAQASVDLKALSGQGGALADNAAYAQSKLAITMWSKALAKTLANNGPIVVAVNPGSLLGTKMVKDAYGIPGGDIQIGADIIVRAALSAEFADASGKYFDNDADQFAPPHPDALDAKKCARVVSTIEDWLATIA